MSTSEHEHWHLDRRVPLALILTIVIQTVGIVWWASSLTERVAILEKKQDAAAPQGDRITRLEVNIEFIRDGVNEIKNALRKAAPQ